ncbi:MAG TPA: PAS domain-containing protein [Polyangia bacterium]|nr:PAS domain-containing protein [Polyangia bacterium]
MEDSFLPRGLEGCIEAFDAELDYLCASLRRLGARTTEIEELVHQVFLLLVPAWPSLAGRKSLRLHLFGLAARVIARRRVRRVEAEPGSAESDSLVRAALSRVPLRRRAVLVLSELDQVPSRKIARILSMTRMGVALRLRQARSEMNTAIRQLALDWQAGRFGRRDRLFAALGWRPEGFPLARPGSETDARSSVVSSTRQLQDDIFLFQIVMDNLPETIYFKDRQSRFTHINRYAAAHYGIGDPALAVGRTDFDFFTDEHAVQALQDEQEIIRTGRPLVSIRERETLPNGRSRSVRTTKLPLHAGDGEIVGTFGLSRDITITK